MVLGKGPSKRKEDDCSRCDDDWLLAQRELEKRRGSLWGTRQGSKSK